MDGVDVETLNLISGIVGVVGTIATFVEMTITIKHARKAAKIKEEVFAFRKKLTLSEQIYPAAKLALELASTLTTSIEDKMLRGRNRISECQKAINAIRLLLNIITENKHRIKPGFLDRESVEIEKNVKFFLNGIMKPSCFQYGDGIYSSLRSVVRICKEEMEKVD